MRKRAVRAWVAIAATALLGVAAVQVPEGVTAYASPGEGVFPEGVAYHAARGAAFVAGAGGGALYRIDLASGDVDTGWTPGTRPPFGVIGLAAATDSSRAVLFRIPAGSDEVEAWLDLGGTPIPFGDGINLNGIVASDDGGHLITVHTGSGTLYRIDVTSRDGREGGRRALGHGRAVQRHARRAGGAVHDLRGADRVGPKRHVGDPVQGATNDGAAPSGTGRPVTARARSGRSVIAP